MRHSYFDHNATSPLAPEVLHGFAESLADVYGNASSIHHFGQIAKQRLETARRQIAVRIGCDAREIVFTSGGTESDNLAVFGSTGACHGPNRVHVITSAIEHPAILNSCARLEREGFGITYVAVGASGVVDPDDVKKALRPDTKLITIMHGNNEIGTLQPVSAIAQIARAAGVPCHSDGVQTGGRVPVNVRSLGVDLFSMSGHKFGAPKGIGALYVRKGVELTPLLYGGRHERGLRAGTENVPGATAMGKAASLDLNWESLAPLRDRMESEVLARVPFASINGDPSRRLPNTSNIRFSGIGGEAMVIALDLRGYAVSSGSACSSGAVEPSHVLLAMGQTPDEARSSVRFSLGPSTSEEEVDGLIEAVVESAAHLRRVAPAVAYA